MRNLDPRLYIAPEVFERERERVFWRTWQLLGPASRVAEAGRYVAADVAGAKVFAVRGRDGRLRAFRNVCRHRGARLLEDGAGHCSLIRCPYHNWAYDLDGTLKQAPWFGEEPGFAVADWPLEEIAVDVWRGLLFIAVEPTEPLLTQLAAAVPELAGEPIETYRHDRSEHLMLDANWKVYTDNFVEGYHIPGIHPAFFQAIEFEEFETTAHPNLVRMTAPPRPGLFYRGKWLWMWPNWTLSLFAGGMNTSRINPLSAGRTELVYDFYFSDVSEVSKAARDDTIARNLAVVREDFTVCLDTHANYAVGAYSPGPLSPRHEQGVAWFQRRIAEVLATPSASPD
jgi:choline monooxygenase